MKARCGLRSEDNLLSLSSGDAQLLDGTTGQRFNTLEQLAGEKVNLFRTQQIAHTAALMRAFYLLPPGFDFSLRVRGLIEQRHRVGQQIEERSGRQLPFSAGDASVELPAGKHAHASGRNRPLDYFV